MITCDQVWHVRLHLIPSDSSRLSQSSDCALRLTDYPSNILTDMSNHQIIGQWDAGFGAKCGCITLLSLSWGQSCSFFMLFCMNSCYTERMIFMLI